MNITYDYYRIFYYVAKYQSFTLAANALYSSQPNVTRAIKKLEGELGCTLFIRSNRGAELTPEGEQLFSHISAAVEHIRAGEEALLIKKSLQNGIVTVSITETALHCFMLPILKKFRAEYPGIQIRIFNHSTPQALNSLKAGLCEIAVVTAPAGDKKTFSEKVMKEYRNIAVCSRAFPELLHRSVTFEELSKYPLVSLGKHTKINEFYTNLFLKRGLIFNPDIEAATADQILPLVKNDLGIGFVPEEFYIKEHDKSNLFTINLCEPIPNGEICLAKNKGRSLSIAAKELERIMLSESE